MNYDLGAISKNIKEYRKRNKLTQEQLAEDLNYSVKAVASWEQGISTPPLDILITISTRLDMSLEDFICAKGESLTNFVPDSIVKEFFKPNETIKIGEKTFDLLLIEEGEFIGKFYFYLYELLESIDINQKGIIIKAENDEKMTNYIRNKDYYKMLNKAGLVSIEGDEMFVDKSVANYLLKETCSSKAVDLYYDYMREVELKYEDDVLAEEDDPSLLEYEREEELRRARIKKMVNDARETVSKLYGGRK